MTEPLSVDAMADSLPRRGPPGVGLTLADRIFCSSIPVPECGCWIWLGTVPRRYGAIKVNGRNMSAHRASWEAHHGPIPNGLWVLHKCDVPVCVNPDHLFLGTRQDNVDDMIRKGRDRRGSGERHGSAKLTEQQVLAIRASSLSSHWLAKQYGVRDWTIRQILTRQTWKFL